MKPAILRSVKVRLACLVVFMPPASWLLGHRVHTHKEIGSIMVNVTRGIVGNLEAILLRLLSRRLPHDSAKIKINDATGTQLPDGCSPDRVAYRPTASQRAKLVTPSRDPQYRWVRGAGATVRCDT